MNALLKRMLAVAKSSCLTSDGLPSEQFKAELRDLYKIGNDKDKAEVRSIFEAVENLEKSAAPTRPNFTVPSEAAA